MPKNAVPLYIVLVLSLLDQISARGDSDKADIVVAFHASSSTSREDFQSLLTFVKGLVSRADFDEGRARLGVLAYGENPHVQFHLHEYRTWTDVYNAISNINDNVRSNIVDTSGALIESLIMFDYQYTRTDVSKAVFLITDAASTINDNYLSDLTLVMQNENIEVFPIGIGIWDKSELETIATSPKNVYTVSQYSKLQTLTNILRQDVQSLKPRETGYDLVVILDSSVSQEYFDWMTTFTKHLADTICIDDGEFKVGLLRYSTDSNVQFNLKDYQSSGNVRKAVDNVRYQGGITNTAQAIDTARTQMFRPDQGDRDYARNFILLITGQNKSLSTSDAWRAAERAEKDGIQLYVIGLNINDSVELDETSSHPLTTYQYLTKSRRELELVPPQIYADLLRMSKNPPSMRQRPTIPTVRVLSTRYPVKYRTSVTLECVVDSYPPHTKVTWYRITNGDRTEMEKVTDYCGSTVNVPSLTINRADFYDNGNYVCTAENVAGVGSSEETRVIVSGACGLTKVDIVIILESSASVNDSNFQKMKNFCKDFLKNADLDSGNIQIGIVSYSTGVHIEFQMNDYSTSQDIMEAIDAIPYRNGSKNTADGLRIMRSQMFTAANGDRDGVPNVILILTDGWSNISSQRTFSEAEQARAKGINIYSIGIGLRDTRELNDMASEPASENSFNIQDFDEFAAVSDQVFQAVCLVKPDVVIKPNRSPVLYGGPVTIECTVKSDIPVKEVTWYRVEGDSRTPIVQDGKKYSGSTVRVSYFTINHANFQDEGTYVCSAENAAGVGSSTNGEVDVTGAPPVVSIPKKEYTEDLGTEVTLECDVVANPPETTVYWRREDRGQMVDVDTTSSRYSRVSPTSPSLTLTNLDTSDSGMYQCFADNPVGTGQSQQTSLKVLLPITLPISETTEIVATTEKPRKTGYDLVIILDSSVSQEYFDLMKTFTKHLAYTISIDDQEFRVGLLTYSTDSKVQFNLNDYKSSDNVKNAVDKVQNRGGLTNTANAIDTVRTQMFTPAHGDRDYARNFIFLITGQDKSLSRTDAWRAAEKAETDGIGLYVIGFNINDRDELDEISSHPLSTYQYLIRSERELAEGPHQIYAGLLGMPKTPLTMRPRPVSAMTPIGTVFQRTTAYRTASTFPPSKS